jgi:TatD DNase family protein
LLDRALAAGVNEVVAIAVDVDTSHWNAQVAARRRGVVAAVGVHPAHLTGPIDPASLAALEKVVQQPAVGFLGEIGIDTVDGRVELATQVDAFRAQLRLAERCRKPINLHLRGAIDVALSVLAESYAVESGAVFHYFVGDEALAERLLEAGLMISVGKPVTRPNNATVRAAIQRIPLDRLLLETDSYPLPGRSTEPAHLPLVAQAVAALHHCDIGLVDSTTTENFRRLVEPI